MMGSFTTGSVHCTQSAGGIKLGGSAREFIKNVISGIQDNKGEQWVRQQFYNYTKQFLNSVEGDRMSKDHRKWLSNFAQSELYQRYKADLKNAKPNEEVQNPLETFHMLHKVSDNSFAEAMKLKLTPSLDDERSRECKSIEEDEVAVRSHEDTRRFDYDWTSLRC